MDLRGVNAMGPQGGMSMPMSMAMPMPNSASGGNPQGMGIDANAVAMTSSQYDAQPKPQHQIMNVNTMNTMNQMNMGTMGMKMDPSSVTPAAGGGMQVFGGQSIDGADWRIQLTREHRANLIAKIYNEMVRGSADPVPGIKLWMNVSWYELTLYKESRTQEEYINKIFTRLKSLRAQQSDMNAATASHSLPNQGLLSRLDFSYYSTLNMSQRAAVSGVNSGQVGSYPGPPQFGGPTGQPAVQQQQQSNKPIAQGGGVPANATGPAPRTTQPEVGMSADAVARYWQQHAALKSKYHDDVVKVHSAFKKYVDHVKGHDETKKKLRYLLSYVQLCASVLSEDKTTHAPRQIEELDKVYKYIVKIVNPYLKKLRTETDKHGSDSSAATTADGSNVSVGAGSVSSSGVAMTTSSGVSGAMGTQQRQQGGAQAQQQLNNRQQHNATSSSAQNQQGLSHQTAQQKQQQYMMQQRAQQTQQQQRLQAQATRQQQMMQQHQMMQQQKGPQAAQQQARLALQQANQMKQEQGSDNQQNGQHTQQQMGQHTQRGPIGQQQTSQAQQGSTRQQPRSHSQTRQLQHQSGQSRNSSSRGQSPSPNIGLDESLYGEMDSSGLLQMPSNLASPGPSTGYMSFSNDLSPTNFSGIDLLDMESGLSYDGQDGASSSAAGRGNNNSNSNGGSSAITR